MCILLSPALWYLSRITVVCFVAPSAVKGSTKAIKEEPQEVQGVMSFCLFSVVYSINVLTNLWVKDCGVAC